MKVLYKIRTSEFRKELYKNFFVLFIYCFIFFRIHNYSEEIKENFYKTNNSLLFPEKYIYKYSLFKKNTSNLLYVNGIIGIISGNNKDFTNELFQFLKESKIVKAVKIFNSTKELSHYLKSKEYENLKIEMNYIIEISNKNDSENEIEVKFGMKGLEHNSIKESSHKLNILEDNRKKINAFKKVIRFSEHQEIITNFLRYYTTRSINTKIESGQFINNLTHFLDYSILTSFSILSIYLQMQFFGFHLQIINEKSKYYKELFLREGITIKQYYISWFFVFLLYYSIPCLVTIYYSLMYFKNLNSFIVLSVIILYFFNSFLLIIFVHLVFKKKEIIYYIFAMIILSIIVFYNTENNLSKSLIIFLMIIPDIGLLITIKHLIRINALSQFSWEIFTMNYINEFSIFFNLTYSFILMFLFIISITIVIYIQNYKKQIIKNKEGVISILENSNIEQNDSLTKTYYEKLNKEEENNKTSNNSLIVKNLTKKYNDLKVLDNFSGIFFPGEIFCLLGENGVGKTTLMKLLSGIENPDGGDILIDGESFIENKMTLLKKIGFSQQEYLFENFTVIEHIKLFLNIRGEENIDENIILFINDIKLDLKANYNSLSLGDKFKLNIILSLIGNKRVILLDEPTIGFDRNSRKELWKFLKKYKKDKIIILTTHLLEEAELFGDKIGIIKDGKLICSGSSYFLKEKFPNGFNISFFIKSKFNEENRQQLLNGLKEIIPTFFIRIKSNSLIQINFSTKDKKAINDLFEYIEESKKDFDITNYTISTTSLEDIFINIINRDKSKKLNLEKKNIDLEDIEQIENNKFSFFAQLKENIKKNILSSLKSLLILYIFFILFLFYLISLHYSSKNFQYVNVEELLNKNKIYIFSNESEYITSSKYYNKINKSQIEFKTCEINFPNISSFMHYIYNQSSLRNEKNIIYFHKDLNDIKIYNLYQSYSPDYYQASMNMLINIITEKEFNLIINSGSSYKNNKNIDRLDSSFFSFMFTYIILISAFLIETPIKERVRHLKYLLYLNGNSMVNYWLGIFISDLIKSTIVIFFIFFSLFILGSDYNFLILIIGYLIAMSTFSYFLSLFINVHHRVIFFIIYIVPYFFMYLFELINIFNQTFLSGYDFTPITLLYRIIYKTEYFDNSKIKRNFLVFILQFFLYGIFFIIKEFKLIGKKEKDFENKTKNEEIVIDKNENSDSLKQNLIDNNFNDEKGLIPLEKEKNDLKDINTPIKIISLSKMFITKECCKKKENKILQDLNLSLDEDEKFGLIGNNGSGKTTILKLIIRELKYDSGEIYLFGSNINDNIDIIRNKVGYCPQEIKLFNKLTVEQTLNYFKHLKKVSINIEHFAKKFGLENYLNTNFENLSQGNKRKLYFAITLMNKPKLLLLDEPTTGIDPENRRMMFNNLFDLSLEHKFNMILIPSSMEEAEILCDRIGWLDSGKIDFIGNSEQLKIEHSAGYILKIKFKKENKINNNNIDINYEELEKKLANEISGYDKISKNFNNNYDCLNYLNIIINSIKPFSTKISLEEIDLDNYSFEFLIKFDDNQKGKFFSNILNLKNDFEFVQEVSIKMESLETIITNLMYKKLLSNILQITNMLEVIQGIASLLKNDKSE